MLEKRPVALDPGLGQSCHAHLKVVRTARRFVTARVFTSSTAKAKAHLPRIAVASRRRAPVDGARHIRRRMIMGEVVCELQCRVVGEFADRLGVTY
jgi:hypothetical protein